MERTERKPGNVKTRRQFLSQSAMLAAGALLSPSRAAANPTQPSVAFPANPRDRLAVASYPFRDFILPAEGGSASASVSSSSTAPKMELTEFAAHVKSRFNINKIEPWSSHFRSLEPKYLDGLRTALDAAKSAVVNIAFDGRHSFYAADPAERERAAAAILGSPSIRTHIASPAGQPPNNQPPDLTRSVDTLLRIVEHAAKRNVVIHLENDDGVTEDPVFLVKLIETVN